MDNYEAGYDLYLNAIIGGGSMQTCIATLKGMGLTDKQLRQMKNTAIKQGMIVPEDDLFPKLTPKIIKWSDKFAEVPDSNKFQDTADQFLLFIYGFKFNEGIHGAFEKAQNIKTEARGYTITLVFPQVFQTHMEIQFPRHDYIRKIKSSISHYEKNGRGKVNCIYQ